MARGGLAWFCKAVMHIGLAIKQQLKLQRRSASWLAGEIHCTRTHIYKIFDKQTIDIELLMRISRALDHDFFADLSAEM